MHEAAFQEWGAVPEEIRYDRMRTVWLGSDGRGEVIWQPVFVDFARYWGFKPRLCRPYRAQTKDHASYCTASVRFEDTSPARYFLRPQEPFLGKSGPGNS
jgi:transposase